MQLTFRTIGNKIYQIDFDLSETVQAVKSRIASAYDYDIAKMRLIFKAKVLPDSRTLAELGVDGNGFIVLHAVPLSASSSAKKPTISENSPASVDPVVSVAPEPTPEPEPFQLSSEPLPSLPQAPGPRIPGFQQKVANLVSMGFSRGDCEVALRASLGNVDRAADFLLSGRVPEMPNLISTTDLPVSDSDAEDSSVDDQSEEEDEEGRLRRFRRFRDSLIRDPASLRTFLAQMAEDNPAIAGLIRDDPAAFLGSLGLNPSDFNLQGLGRTTQYEELMSGFSDAEKASIHNLEQLGFDTMTIIQVFVACNKDEGASQACLRSMQ
jgi:UV excision repair protein RAD23